MANYFTQITDYLLTQSWQIAILVAAIGAITLALKNKSAHVRYLLWLIVLAKCLVPPLLAIPLPVLPPDMPAEPVPVSPRQIPMLILDADYATSPELPGFTADAAPTPTGPVDTRTPSSFTVGHRFTTRQWLGLGWLTGAAVFTIAALAKACHTILWLRRRRKPLPAKLQTWIENQFSGLGFGPLPKVWLIEDLSQPFVWGLLRGSIYLPTDFVRLNRPEHRRGVLGHELSHVLRHDAAMNLLQVIAQAIFWFHPFVWWANKRIRAEREKCCDEMAIARLGAKAKDYSTAIVNTLIAERKSTRPVPSLAVAGPAKNIEERIKTMMRPGRKFYKRPSLMAATVVLLLALLTVPTAFVLTARAQRPEPVAAESMEAGAGASITAVSDQKSDAGTIPEANLQIPDELKPCAERLRTIYYALKRYEKDKGNMPDWLSDLVPGYLSAEMLIWPEDGPKSSPLAAEPHLPCSFGYQYSSLGQVSGGGMSYRQFKDQERLIWGDVVPLVRYYRDKDHKCLNLSFDGRIYFSSSAWEKEIPTLNGQVLTNLETVSIQAAPTQVLTPTEPRPWGPEQATGEPDTKGAGDFATAWAPLEADAGPEWLKVEFVNAVNIGAVRIRVSFNPGAISKISAILEDGREHVLWEGEDPTAAAYADADLTLVVGPAEGPSMYAKAYSKTNFLMDVELEQDVVSRSVKIYLDTKRKRGWNEIDAVQLFSRDGSSQWACGATASSTHATGITRSSPPAGAVSRPRAATTRAGGAKGRVLALDNFDGKLGLKWDILRPDKSHYSLSERPGALTITTQDGHFKQANADYENVFLIDTPAPPDQDFQITTCLLAFQPLEPYHQAGLICWDDQNNYLEWVYQKMNTRGLNFNAGVEADGPTQYTYIPADAPPEKLWLRVTKRGNSYECSSSTDGQSFTVHTVENWGDGSPRRIGLFALNGSLTQPPEVDASFDFFEVSEIAAKPIEAAGSTQKFTIPQANLEIPAEMRGCAQNLQAIYAALKEYERDKGRMPDWLSQLVPRYLGPQTLFCTRDPSRKSRYWPDPNLPCSYCYELNPTELRSRPPLDKTMRHYKNQQRESLGDVVPIVRCFHHEPTVLNLAWDGRLYTSAVMFEQLFTPVYRRNMPQAGAEPKPAPTPPSAGTPGPVTKTEVLASDDFDGKLALKWEIINPNPSNYSLSKKAGSLTITAKKGHFSKGNKKYENVFLVDSPAAEGQDFQITTCILSFAPKALWNQAGILCWDDEDNYVKLVYEWAGQPAFTLGYEVGSKDRYNYYPAPSRIDRLWLRITKRGDSYQCATSTDGESFVLCGSLSWKKDSPKRLGLFANNGSFWRGEVPDLDASFEFFEVALAPPEYVETTSAAPGTHTYDSDLEAFIQEMDGTYPFFELKGIRDDWEKTKKQLRQEIKNCKSDEQFLGIVTEGILCLRDSHMWFRNPKAPLPQRPPRYYPGISFMPATNERVVIMSDADEVDPDLKTGTVVTKIDGTDARRYLEDRAKAAWAEGGNSGPQRARLFAYRFALRGEKKGEKHTITILVDGKQRQIELVSNTEAGGWPHWYNRPGDLKQVGSCSYARLPSGAGYVYLRRIDSSAGSGLKEAFSRYPDAKGWIIDLRGNGGGGYDQALYEALQALPSPLAAIIDAGCISAGETMARDLARYGNARLFGSKTAGASSAKRTWTFPSGIASLSVPTRSRWGIDGKPIEFLGIEPHVQVEAVPEELKRGLNSGIIRAEEYLAEIASAQTQ